MARLKDFRHYLDDRRAALENTEILLCELQEKFESYFAEVAKARENELAQLIEHTLADRSSLPGWYIRELDSAQRQVEAELSAKIETLEGQRTLLLDRAEEARAASLDREKRVKTLNSALDREEEQLKVRNATLLAEIEAFNHTISDMGRGFGFFSNLFKMRQLAARKKAIDVEQNDVSARIEALRARWKRSEGEHGEKEQQLQIDWRQVENEAAALSTKLESVRRSQAQLVVRTTVERVLAKHRGEDPSPSDDDPKCSRCTVGNPSANHFCHICAQRLGGDRPDFDGSMEEMAEINRHFERFSEGMAACQQIIGLVRGLKSGVDAFTESVAEVQESERKYPLPKLEISVPDESVAFGRGFDTLLKMAKQSYSVHPKVFASHIEQVIGGSFDEEAIKGYFERMGGELSTQADSQWK